MDKLMERGLLQSGLVRLDTPELIGRYNRALEMLGIEPVELEVLHVDGAGWSPEVANLRQTNFYLSHGIANPLAVIVCPQQYKMPVYFPMFSWMRGILRQLFEKSYREIMDITATHPITIDFEEGLSTFEGPTDLLLLYSVKAVPDADGICEAGMEQAELVALFLDDLNCLQTVTLTRLEEHVQKHGDLRKRLVCLTPLEYDFFRDFYSVAFDGVAVLRNVGADDILVLNSEAVYESIRKQNVPGTHLCYVGDAEYTLFRTLGENGWLTFPIEKFRGNAKLLDEKREVLLAWHLLERVDDPLWAKNDWLQLRPTQRKKLVEEHKDSIPKIYFELERYAAKLKSGKPLPELSFELWLFLAIPAEHLHVNTQEVVWILLTRRDPRNLLELYTYDKNAFVALYNTWPEPKRKWAADYLVTRYELRHKQP